MRKFSCKSISKQNELVVLLLVFIVTGSIFVFGLFLFPPKNYKTEERTWIDNVTPHYCGIFKDRWEARFPHKKVEAIYNYSTKRCLLEFAE